MATKYIFKGGDHPGGKGKGNILPNLPYTNKAQKQALKAFSLSGSNSALWSSPSSQHSSVSDTKFRHSTMWQSQCPAESNEKLLGILRSVKTWPMSRENQLWAQHRYMAKMVEWYKYFLKSCYVQGFNRKNEYNERRNIKVNWKIIFFENWKIQYPEWKRHWMHSIAHWLDTAEENIYECANYPYCSS